MQSADKGRMVQRPYEQRTVWTRSGGSYGRVEFKIMTGDYLGRVVIDGKLPGLNEVIASNRCGWRSGSGDKKYATACCKEFAAYAMRKTVLKPIKCKVTVKVTWYEQYRRRDHDNILGGGLKMAFDGFVRAGLIPDDSQKYIGRIESEVKIDRNKPRIEFEFYEE